MTALSISHHHCRPIHEGRRCYFPCRRRHCSPSHSSRRTMVIKSIPKIHQKKPHNWYTCLHCTVATTPYRIEACLKMFLPFLPHLGFQFLSTYSSSLSHWSSVSLAYFPLLRYLVQLGHFCAVTDTTFLSFSLTPFFLPNSDFCAIADTTFLLSLLPTSPYFCFLPSSDIFLFPAQLGHNLQPMTLSLSIYALLRTHYYLLFLFLFCLRYLYSSLPQASTDAHPTYIFEIFSVPTLHTFDLKSRDSDPPSSLKIDPSTDSL